MIRIVASYSLLMIAAALPLVVQAQNDPVEEEAEPLRRYTVEVIVFGYNENVSTGNEVFVAERVPEPDPLVEELIEPPAPDNTAPLLSEDTDTVSVFEFSVLDEDQLTMFDEWGHLDRLDVYEPLMHFGWTQTTHPQALTEARPLSTFVEPALGFDGEFKLYLERYLHLVVDLSLLADPTAASALPVGPAIGYADSVERFQPLRYRIQEDRIFKSGDIRYFDHPKFGMLAKIVRVEEEPSTELNVEPR